MNLKLVADVLTELFVSINLSSAVDVCLLTACETTLMMMVFAAHEGT